MKWLVSGEGATDIGTCAIGSSVSCRGEQFEIGPMAAIIDRLLEPIVDYSPLAFESICLLRKQDLTRRSRRSKSLRFVALPGKKADTGTRFFFKNALALARAAREMEAEDRCPVCAVLFRDADGTHTSSETEYAQKLKSMELGFKAADGFDRGVPMIPKPKSEAWLICALKEDSPYSFCDRLEETLPGNDDSPNSAKMQLAEILLAKGKSTSDLAEMVMNQEIHPDRIDMPSFNSFRQRLELVAREMIRS